MTDEPTENDGAADEGVVRRDRFSGGPARSFLSALEDDERIFAADLAVDRAHVVMLAEQDIIADDVAGEILEALEAIEVAGHAELPTAEDVHEAIETDVVERVGLEGGRMHTARSRNDEVATCIRYRLREDVLTTLAAVLELRDVLCGMAESHRETIMPGYTHLQSAQPTTVAHWALSYESTLRRDAERLLEAYGRVNQSPLGAAAFAGTPFDIDRERTADLLGFDSVLENAMDAAASRDVLIEVAGHHATLATTLSGLAEDLVLFAHREFIELDDDYASTSSIMPQKKNPDTLELVRATAGDATSGLAGLLTTIKGLPRAYNRDLQQATPHVWSAVDAVTEATTVTAGALETLTWDETALAEAAGEGFSTATGIADALAMSGLPFRTAHEAVAKAADDGGDLEAIAEAVESITGDPLETYIDRDTVKTTLQPAASVAIRDSVGGPAPAAVDEALATARETLAEDLEALAATRESIAEAETTLQDEVDRYA